MRPAPAPRSFRSLLRVLVAAAVIATVTIPAQAVAPPGRWAASPLFVRDTQTGLLWQREAAGERTRDEAAAYCENLRLGLSGYRWRLPVVEELVTLVDVRGAEAALDATVFAGPLVPFWTATPYAPDADARGWSVDFTSGVANGSSLAARLHVRCVRN